MPLGTNDGGQGAVKRAGLWPHMLATTEVDLFMTHGPATTDCSQAAQSALKLEHESLQRKVGMGNGMGNGLAVSVRAGVGHVWQSKPGAQKVLAHSLHARGVGPGRQSWPCRHLLDYPQKPESARWHWCTRLHMPHCTRMRHHITPVPHVTFLPPTDP